MTKSKEGFECCETKRGNCCWHLLLTHNLTLCRDRYSSFCPCLVTRNGSSPTTAPSWQSIILSAAELSSPLHVRSQECRDIRGGIFPWHPGFLSINPIPLVFFIYSLYTFSWVWDTVVHRYSSKTNPVSLNWVQPEFYASFLLILVEG